jgi:hypothetical protein
LFVRATEPKSRSLLRLSMMRSRGSLSKSSKAILHRTMSLADCGTWTRVRVNKPPTGSCCITNSGKAIDTCRVQRLEQSGIFEEDTRLLREEILRPLRGGGSRASKAKWAGRRRPTSSGHAAAESATKLGRVPRLPSRILGAKDEGSSKATRSIVGSSKDCC